jgi:hypothetical protein
MDMNLQLNTSRCVFMDFTGQGMGTMSTLRLSFTLRYVVRDPSLISCDDMVQEFITLSVKNDRAEPSIPKPMRSYLCSSVSIPGTHLAHIFLYRS